MKKFDKIYKMIMEGVWYDRSSYQEDPGQHVGRVKYNAGSVGEGNVQLYGKLNGNPVIDTQTGQPAKWTVMAQWQPSRDYLTGQKLISGRTVFQLKWGYGKKNTIYIARETYENAYAENDQEMIAKLKAIGLQPGYIFGDDWGRQMAQKAKRFAN